MWKTTGLVLLFALGVSLAASEANGQVYNSNSGGYNTGYGTVYGSFGMAAASQSMYNTMQMNMQRAILNQTIANRSGAGSRASSTAARTAATRSPQPVAPPKLYGRFRPDASVDTGKIIADALADTPEEKALIKQIVNQTKASFEKEVAAKGWKNNIAGAFTFFIVATSTIYHDTPDPSDATVNALYDAMNRTIDEIPEFARMSNRDKQGIYNTLVGFAGIPLATYAEGKGANHEATLDAARELAGKLIEIVLRTSPDRFKFENGEMKFN